MRRTLCIAVILVMAAGASPKGENSLAHAAAPKAVAETPIRGDMLVEASIGDASNLIPMLSADNASMSISGLIYNGLVQYNPKWEIEGDLAESWEIKDSGKTIIFHLRKGVKWHDGAPFTSADVMFGYKTIIQPGTRTAYAEPYMQVKKAEAPDDYTFIVHYDKPYAPALESWGSLPVLPKHLLEGKDINNSPLSRKPVGTGPYKFVEWAAQERIILQANKEYFKGEPYFTRYAYRIIPDSATQFLELKAGSIDMMTLNPVQYARQTNNAEFEKNFQKFKYVANAYTYMGYNFQRPLFKDKRVRKAIAYAVDKNEIIQGALMGFGKPAAVPYKPGTWMYNPKVQTYPFDPAKAQQLLAEAGWTQKDKDGILMKDGKRFEFEIITNQGNDKRKKAAEIIQQRLKTVGIGVKFRVIEWSSFLKEFINKRNFDACLLGWTTGPEPDQYEIWHSSKTKEQELNFISFKNEEVDDLLEKGRRTFDQGERKKIYDRFQDILAEEQPYLFLYYEEALPAVSARIRGIELYESTMGIGYEWPVKWYVPKLLQKYAMQP